MYFPYVLFIHNSAYLACFQMRFCRPRMSLRFIRGSTAKEEATKGKHF